MKILIVGAGGREHALAWAVSASPLCQKLYCAPGNAGIAELAECVAISTEDVAGLVAFAEKEKIDFVIIGPEAPLVAGLADGLGAAGIRHFGPSAKASALEGSKGYMKDFCARHHIPTAAYGRFTQAREARGFIAGHSLPLVLKTDGLAAGKGVIIAQDAREALLAVESMMGKKIFGAAGDEIIVEEFLEGEEVSFFALTDGKNALALASAQDHKRVGENDTGPNTGGMGAYSPAAIVDAAMEKRIMEEIILPTVAGMEKDGAPYKGVLFAGLMIKDGVPKLLEFNVRFGDPECQVLMMRLKSDFLTALMAVSDGALAHFDLRWREDAAITVVMAAKGYPGDYEKGSPIGGLEAAGALDGVEIFHAGTKREGGKIVANGGRVLNVTARGRDLAEARSRAYDAVDLIDWPEGFCRRDIAAKALKA